MSNHSVDNKRIVKNTVYLYARLILSLIIGLYTSRAILDALGVENYGIYNVVGGAVSMLTLFTGAITSAAQRFITFAIGEKDEDKLKKTFSTFASLFILIAIFIFILGESLSVVVMEHLIKIPETRLQAGYWVYHFSLLSFSIGMVAIPYNATVIAYEKMIFYAIVSIGESVFRLVIVYLLYTTSFDRLVVYAALLCGVSITIRVIYGTYCKKHFKESNYKFSIDISIFKEVFSYSFWVLIGTSSAVLKEQGINILINRFFGVTMNAARGISVQVYSIIGKFSSSIGNAITPQITKSFASGELQRSITLTFLLAKAQGILLVFLSLPLFLEANYILGVWLKEVPYYAVTFTQWVLILNIARTQGGTIVPLLLANGKVRDVHLVSGGLLLLNLPVSYIALKMGAAPVSTMIIGTIIELMALFSGCIFLKYYVNFPVIQFWIKSICSVFLVSILAAVVPGLIRYVLLPESFLRFVIVGFTSCLMVVVFSYFLVLNNNEKTMVRQFVSKKLSQISHR